MIRGRVSLFNVNAFEPASSMNGRSSAALVAAIALFCAVAWVAINVTGNYRGHISGLFYTGSDSPLPADIAPHTWRVRDETGYDGQFYHLIAHDPLLDRGFARFIDNPPLRWRRIAVPGLAAMLALGHDGTVDAVYLAIELVFVFLGTFWLAEYARSVGMHAAWGLAFLLIPAVAVSLDRMTIDLPLGALTIGLVRYRASRSVYAILLAAPLVRETGMLLVLAWCLYSVLRREWRPAALGIGCALPSLAWWTWVRLHTRPDLTPWLSTYPFSGILERTIHGVSAPVSTLWLGAASLFESVALAGIWLALILSVYLAWKRRFELPELTAIVFAAFAATLGKFDIWASAYAAGRTMSPLLIVLGLIALRDRRPAFALPLLLLLPRLALQYEAELVSAVRSGLVTTVR